MVFEQISIQLGHCFPSTEKEDSLYLTRNASRADHLYGSNPHSWICLLHRSHLVDYEGFQRHCSKQGAAAPVLPVSSSHGIANSREGRPFPQQYCQDGFYSQGCPCPLFQGTALNSLALTKSQVHLATEKKQSLKSNAKEKGKAKTKQKGKLKQK